MWEKKSEMEGYSIRKTKTLRWVSLQINKQAMKFLPYLFASSNLASSSAVLSFSCPSFSSGFEDPLRMVVFEEEEEEEVEGASGTSDFEATGTSLVDIEIN